MVAKVRELCLSGSMTPSLRTVLVLFFGSDRQCLPIVTKLSLLVLLMLLIVYYLKTSLSLLRMV